MIDPKYPLIDLHRHLDGNVRLETILDISYQNNIKLPAQDIEGLRPYVQVMEPQPGVMAFLDRFQLLRAVMVDYDACRRIAYENVMDARDEGLDYVELRFSPWFMAEMHRLKPEGVVEAVVNGVRAGVMDSSLPARLIGIISRTYGPEIGWLELDALFTQRDQITGLDLAGDEANFPGTLFVDHFMRARQAGWQITVHAGEIDGPQSIWQAIQGLGATRIGHAVQAQADAALLDFMFKNNIGIEANLTSNVQTSMVSSYAKHPIKGFLQKGLKVALCTDDPGISNIDLHYEYDVAAPAAGLTQNEIRQAQYNALEIAFLDDIEKRCLLLKKTHQFPN